MALNQGLIQIYNSPEGAFNFAPLGLALRAAGRGLKNLVVRFSAHEMDQAYPVASIHLKPFLVSQLIDSRIHKIDRGGHLSPLRHEGLKLIQQIESGKYDLIHLLDIDIPLESDIILLEELLEACRFRPNHVELVLSGILLPPPLFEIADLVTTMTIKDARDTRDSTRARKNIVEVVTGNGKGKTTYALGKILLASSLGTPSLFLQFIKSPLKYGETLALNRLPNCTIKTLGKGFIFKKDGAIQEKHLKAALEAWAEFRRELKSMRYKLIVLDEINIAIHYNLLDPNEVVRAIEDMPAGIHLILTGRAAHPDIIKAAHKVIEMQEIKHPYHKGIKARKGIEY